MREALDHTIFCVGYRIMQKDPRRNTGRRQAEGSGCSLWTALWESQNGQDVTLEDGTKIIAADYISAPRPGKIITILGRHQED